MATVSIIVPAYNIDEYIGKCLDSILAQTFTDIEVIVINDGSSDNTGLILDSYSKRDTRIRVIHKENGGVSAARNDGIKVATGKYFLFYDGDDFVEPFAVEELVGKIQNCNAEAIIYGYYRWRNGEVVQTCLPVFSEGMYKGQEIITQLLSRFVGFSYDGINAWLQNSKDGLYVENPALWRCMVEADIIRRNSLEFDINLKVGEDTVFISDLLSCIEHCCVLHKCYYYLVYRETSAIATYENDAMKKLDGKTKLLYSRNALTKRVLERSNLDIKGYWQGNVIMSDIELAFLFAKKSASASFLSRYRQYLTYATLSDVKGTVKAFKPQVKRSFKVVPFYLLKMRFNFILFLCATTLNMLKYEHNKIVRP
ncbi:MAG: glycosyltransferase [Oscillospiraceae bacterium]|nr:glycosyltransferase [Oscillospiraceae bacterium]